MRTFFKVILVVCLCLLLPPGLLAAYLAWLDWKSDRFYEARPILHAMRNAYGGDSSKTGLARKVLLTHIPVGTEAAAAVAVLSHEGFYCQLVAHQVGRSEAALQKRASDIRASQGLPEATESKLTTMNCQLSIPDFLGRRYG
jgi:hypothetical protein